MSFIAKNEKCSVCGKAVYAMELIKADGACFHKTCIKCAQCNCTLKLGNYASLGGKFYCKPHFKQLFALKGNYHGGFAEGASAGYVSGPQAGGESPGLGSSGGPAPTPAPTTTTTTTTSSPAPPRITPTPTPTVTPTPSPAVPKITPAPVHTPAPTPEPAPATSWTSAGPSESEKKQLADEKKQLADEKKKLEDERRAFKAETEKHEKEVDALKKATAEAKAAASAPVKKEAPAPAPAGLSTAEEVLCDAFAKLLADPHKKALALSRAKLG